MGIALAVLVAVLATGRVARAGSGLLIGVDDDTLKWTDGTQQVVAAEQALGFGTVRITLQWQPGQSALDQTGQTYIRRAQAAAKLGERVVLGVFGPASSPPTTQPMRDAFCAFIVDALSRARNIRDVVIWNEANSALFWQPQQGAAAAYEALLADCYDVLHKYRSSVNVISSTAPHEDPGAFILALGAAYRASGRTLPIFDTFGQDAYPEASDESPLTLHPPPSLSLDEGDYVRLMQALTQAFGGTAQPVPGAGNVPSVGNLPTAVSGPGGSHGQGGNLPGGNASPQVGGPVTIWYLEDGFETVVPPSERRLYTGHETNRQLVQPVAATTRRASAAPDQVTQIRDALDLAYCQPAVGAWFNFEFSDEVDLAGWQSGLLWADGTPKPSYGPVQAEIAAVEAGSVDCSRFPAMFTGVTPTPSASTTTAATTTN